MQNTWRKNYLRYKSFFLNVITQYKNESDLKAYLEILLSLVTISVFSVFALRPTLLTIAELITEIENKKEIIAKMDSKIENLSKAQILFDRNRQEIVLLENFVIPQKPNIDIFARQIEGLSNKYQVGVSTISLGQAGILGSNTEYKNGNDLVPQNGADGVEFSISLMGNLEQYPFIYNFFGDFENLRTIPKINNFNFKLKDEIKSEQKNLILTISGYLPYTNKDN